MKALSLVFLTVLLASPVHAQFSGLNIFDNEEEQEQESGNAETQGEAENTRTGPKSLNSQYCVFSFFSDEGDIIDFSGSTGDSCFDTGRGRDKFALNPGDFPGGARVYSGSGRSTFRLSNGPTEFFDENSTAREVRAGSGNDTLRFGMDFVAEESRASIMPETRVYPGGGNDVLIVGSGLRDALGPRNISNLLIFPQRGSLGIEAGCGRFTDTDAIDFIVENAPRDARIGVQSQGCGVAMRNHSASTTLSQDGGRTSLVLRPFEIGTPVSVFEADIDNGSSLSAILIEPSENVVLDWQGYGSATVQVEALSPLSGGSVMVSNAGFVFAGINAQEGSPSLSLISDEIVEVSLTGPGVGNVVLSIGAPEARLEWTMETLFPPSLSMPGSVEVMVLYDAEDSEHQGLPLIGVQVEDESEGEIEGEEGAAIPEEDLPPVQEEAQAMVGIERDNLGRTVDGATAVFGGHPVGSVATVEPFEYGPRVMVPVKGGRLDVLLHPRSGGCEVMRVYDDALRHEVACDKPVVVSAAGASRIEFEASGRSVTWNLEDLRLGEITVRP